MIIDNIHAIQSLVGGAITLKADGSIVYHDDQTPPSDSAISTEVVRLQAEEDAQAYARNRRDDYPDMGE